MKGYFKIVGVFGIIVWALTVMLANVNAEEMSKEFRSLLNKDGKLEVHGVKPSNEESFYILFETLFLLDENGEYVDTGYSWNNISDNMNTVDFTINTGTSNEETHTVDIEYVYDNNTKTMVDGYLSKIPADLEFFNVRDMEVINFWVNGKGEVENLINYSSELKKIVDYKNFTIDLRIGDDDKFKTWASGVANFSYNKTIYGMRDGTGVSAEHIIYVDENVGTTKEALISAVQKRIDNYIGKDKVTVTFGGDSVYNLYVDEYDSKISRLEAELSTIDAQLETAIQNVATSCPDGLDSYNETCMNAYNAQVQLESDKSEIERKLTSEREYKDYFIDEYNSADGEYHFLKSAVNDYYFKAKVGNKTYLFIIVKDSSKMYVPTSKTVDVNTNIAISTSNTQIPLDTTISAEKLTSGTEYEKIVDLLKVTDNLTFDLKLYSSSLQQYVTKLDNGTFEVKIPLNDSLKNKENLIVYYIDSNNQVVEYTVTPQKVSDQEVYAVFNTDHFSIYTLAEQTSTNQNQTGNSVVNNNQNTNNTQMANNEKNPQTYDGIIIYIVVGVVSLIGLIVMTMYLRKRNKLRALLN